MALPISEPQTAQPFFCLSHLVRACVRIYFYRERHCVNHPRASAACSNPEHLQTPEPSILASTCRRYTMSRKARSYLDQIDYDHDRDDSVSIASTTAKIKDPIKKVWCQSQWTSLSCQATKLGLEEVYFDQSTNLLDKLTNKKLWTLMVSKQSSPRPGETEGLSRPEDLYCKRPRLTVATE